MMPRRNFMVLICVLKKESEKSNFLVKFSIQIINLKVLFFEPTFGAHRSQKQIEGHFAKKIFAKYQMILIPFIIFGQIRVTVRSFHFSTLQNLNEVGISTLDSTMNEISAYPQKTFRRHF